MKQNKYDDPAFFEAYSAMDRSKGGLEASGEWHAFRQLLPADMTGLDVLDLGCGFGWHCRHASERGARRVVGIDISERMLGRARELNAGSGIEFRHGAIEDAGFPAGSFDLVVSSLAFHYVRDFDAVCRAIARWLRPGGRLVFSQEHPVFTSRDAQDWHYGADGTPEHWPVDRYQEQGTRHSGWLTGEVVKYHRTLAGTLNPLIDAGMRIRRVFEPEPPAEMLARDPATANERRRPMFLIVAADLDDATTKSRS